MRGTGAGNRGSGFLPYRNIQAVLPRVETVSKCHPEAIAEGSRLRKQQTMRDSSLMLRMTCVRVLRLRHSLVAVFEAYLEKKRRRAPETAANNSSAGEPLHYRLSTEIPDYWIPLMPARTAQGLRLKRGAVLNTDGLPEPVHALGRILNPDLGRALELHEEEVPREGVRVTRNYQYARWFDGSTHLWIGRRKQIGRGEGSSGLGFDVVDR